MSRIPDLGAKLQHLPKILDGYEKALKDVVDHINIEGKTIEVANRENAHWQNYYDERRIELRTLVKYFEARVKKVRGKLFKSYTSGPKSNQQYSDRVKDKYIDNEDAYLTMYEVYLEVEEMYEKYEGAVKAFQTRGYALNNITKARVAQVESDIIT